MHATTNAEFAAAMALERMRDAIGGRRLANGQPTADALASALVDDMRQAGAGPADALALEDWRIRDAGLDLEGVLGFGGHGALPFGTPFDSDQPGGVTIAGREYAMDAGRPGLHPVETTRRDAHGPNLALLRAEIERRTRRLACRRIGLPAPSFVTAGDSRHLLQFPPLAEAGGAMLQRFAVETGAPRFCAATPRQIAALADSMVADMRALWRRRADIAAAVAEVRSAAAAGIAAATGPGRAVRLEKVLVDMQHQRDDATFCFHLEYAALDEALRPGLVLDYRDWSDDFGRRPLGGAPAGNERRAAELDELRALGADGRIDDLAAAIVRAAPEGATAVLARLGAELETTVTMPSDEPGAPLYATLFWRDGILRAEASVAGGLDLNGDRMELHAVRLPETLKSALVGRPLSHVIELPFGCDCIVTEVGDLSRGGMRVRLSIGHSLVNTGTGEIWAEGCTAPPLAA